VGRSSKGSQSINSILFIDPRPVPSREWKPFPVQNIQDVHQSLPQRVLNRLCSFCHNSCSGERCRWIVTVTSDGSARPTRATQGVSTATRKNECCRSRGISRVVSHFVTRPLILGRVGCLQWDGGVVIRVNGKSRLSAAEQGCSQSLISWRWLGGVSTAPRS
jgi:hypothetical protein